MPVISISLIVDKKNYTAPFVGRLDKHLNSEQNFNEDVGLKQTHDCRKNKHLSTRLACWSLRTIELTNW